MQQFSALITRLFFVVGILLPQPTGAAAATAGDPASSPSKLECAAFYLAVQNQLQLIDGWLGSAETPTLGPASDWAIGVFKTDGPANVPGANAAIASFAAKIVTLSKGDALDPTHALDHLQPLITAYDAPCGAISGQAPLDLNALAAGKYPYRSATAVDAADAPPPSSVDCAYYYYLATLPFLRSKSSSPAILALLGPHYSWAQRLLGATDKATLEASNSRVVSQMRRLYPEALTNDPRLALGPAMQFFDPPCRVLSGLPALNLDSILEALSGPSQTPK